MSDYIIIINLITIGISISICLILIVIVGVLLEPTEEKESIEYLEDCCKD